MLTNLEEILFLKIEASMVYLFRKTELKNNIINEE